MISINVSKLKNFDSIPIDPFWNLGEESELKMHKIHAYPAKFPAFITTKALEFAKKNNIHIKKVADIFCGCGTVAYETKRNNLDFWGCDLNPVATMIASTKSRKYQPGRLNRYLDDILSKFSEIDSNGAYKLANDRLRYWHEKNEYEDLLSLKKAIEKVTPEKSGYRLFFICAFSNILKSTSRWLTKSIKPQIDPVKVPAEVIVSFKKQCGFMIKANNESELQGKNGVQITTGSFLDDSTRPPAVDLIITSPPYVTSYEYADLHQLSSLWLNYADDYRDLRKGSIGSLYQEYNFNKELKRLNNEGSKIVFSLISQHKTKSKAVAKYFLDMQNAVRKSYLMLNKNGMALFVIGNTEYKGVRIDNAKHLAESLENVGFKDVLISKRKISKKILTPYRDDKGCFTTDKSGRKVYSEEFIIVGKK